MTAPRPARARPDQGHPVAAEYRNLAGRYDRRWARYVEASARETLARAGVADGDRVLDVGCGTGVLLERLAQATPSARLAGVDLVAEMLVVARQRLSANVELSSATAESLPFGDASFEVVISSSVFHYVRQPRRALEESRRVLVPGGRLVLTDWCRDYLTMRALDRYLRLTDRAHFRTYSSDELSGLVASSGFEDVVAARYRLDRFWGLATIIAAAAQVR